MTLDELKRDCSVTKKTIPEVEHENLYEDDGRVPHVPFGFVNKQWLELKKRMLEGDEIYYYNSSPESWKNLAGREGYVIVRSGEVVDGILTTMN